MFIKNIFIFLWKLYNSCIGDRIDYIYYEYIYTSRRENMKGSIYNIAHSYYYLQFNNTCTKSTEI